MKETTKAARRGWGSRGASLAAGALVVATTPMVLAAASGAAQRPKAGSVPTINMAYTAPVADQLIPLLAEKAGIFRHYGVNVNVEPLPQTEALDSLISGQVQMGVFAGPAPEVSQAAGTPLKWLAEWESHADLFFIGRGTSSVAGLAGKSVAVTVPGSTTAVLAQVALQGAHVLNKVHLQPLGNVGATLQSFLAGTTNATVAGPPNQTTLLKEVPGASILVDFRHKYAWPGAGVAALTSWTSKHKAITVDVMKGLIAAVAYFKTHPTKVEAIIGEATGAKPGPVNSAYQSMRGIINETGSLVPPVNAEVEVLKAIRGQYAGAAKLEARSMMDDTYIDTALKDLAAK